MSPTDWLPPANGTAMADSGSTTAGGVTSLIDEREEVPVSEVS